MAPAGRMDDAAAALRLAATRYRANPEGGACFRILSAPSMAMAANATAQPPAPAGGPQCLPA